MAQHQESQTNQSIFSTEQCLQLRKKITLSSLQLIELTYNEQKFNNKLDELNKMACNLIDEEKCLEASVYLDEAERILQYAAGCGKTIERTLITTILNNQACLLQRTSQFQQSANYLQAIIFNINEFIEGSHHFEYSPNFLQVDTPEYAEIAIYFERKLALALYHLRFCALTSHTKNNQAALKSAHQALNTLKELCQEEYEYQSYREKQPHLNKYKLVSLEQTEETYEYKKILKEISRVLSVQKKHIGQFEIFKGKCLESIAYYQKKINKGCFQSPEKYFQTYSIGNLMQASPIFTVSKTSHELFMNEEYSLKGKFLKLVHMSMAHFTVATELRLISASKYSLDDNERRGCPQFLQSKIFHLLAITLISRYLPYKSVFFDHALTSFRNHYGIDLLEEAQQKQQFAQIKDFTIICLEQSKQQSVKGSISHIDEIHTNEQDNRSGSLQNQEGVDNRDEGTNLIKEQMQLPPSKIEQDLMKQINNDKIQNMKKLKQLKSKGKSSSKHITTSFSRVLDSERNMHLLKNKQNKSKTKLMISKGKETAKSRRKDLKTQEDQYGRRGVYYGFQKQSRSRSKKQNLQRKNSKKLITRTIIAFQTKKLKNQTKVGEEYGVKSAGCFGFKNSGDIRLIKNKPGRNSQGPDEENIFSPRAAKFSAVMKKVKSPTRGMKGQAPKKKSMSKDKYIQ